MVESVSVLSLLLLLVVDLLAFSLSLSLACCLRTITVAVVVIVVDLFFCLNHLLVCYVLIIHFCRFSLSPSHHRCSCFLAHFAQTYTHLFFWFAAMMEQKNVFQTKMMVRNRTTHPNVMWFNVVHYWGVMPLPLRHFYCFVLFCFVSFRCVSFCMAFSLSLSLRVFVNGPFFSASIRSTQFIYLIR